MLELPHFLVAVAASICGSLPTAFIVAKRLKAIDIRQHGSGNVGATNVFRVLGKGPGSLVFAIDFLKGFIPVFVFSQSPLNTASYAPLVIGVFAILGHIFTPFLNFKGGKGVATGSGVLAASHPFLFMVSLATWTACFLATRIVSLSSMVSVTLLLVTAWVISPASGATYVLTALSLFILWTHRSNMARLLRGEEKRISK